MDLDSPPRKKLKQARLPFQILSTKDTTSDSSPSSTSRKRQLSEDPIDDIAVIKVVKKSEDFKENKTVAALVKETDDKASALISSSDSAEKDAKSETPLKVKNDVSQVDEAPEKPVEGSMMLTKMKSNLASLFEKKAFDFSAEVGACDCGCEEADSGDEAMEEYLEHFKNKKGTPKSSDSKSKGRAKRKSIPKEVTKQVSPSKQSTTNENRLKGRRSTKAKHNGSIDTKPEDAETENTANVAAEVQTVKSPIKKIPLEKSSGISQKAHDMFAKWRKGSNNLNTPSCNVDQKPVEHAEGGVGKTDGKKKAKTEASCQDLETYNVSKSEMKDETGREDSISKVDLLSKVHDQTDTNEAPTSSTKSATVHNRFERENEKQSGDEVIKPNKSVGKNHLELESSSDSIVSLKGSFEKDELSGSSESLTVVDHEKPSLPSTPVALNKTSQRRLTPKQIERQKDIARKHEEKEKLKQERENEKKRLKQEKDEAKKKEKEEKEEQRKKEKEEKEKKKQVEQEQKLEEKKKKELLKAGEKRKKEEEKKKAEEEKRKAEEEEERKKAKVSAIFTSFFVPKSTKSELEEAPPTLTAQNFMPFEVKAGMRIAPQVRRMLTSSEKQCLDEVVGHDGAKSKSSLYLHTLKAGRITPQVSSRTWPLQENVDDDVCVIDADDVGVLISNSKNVEKMRVKFLQFHENHRPAYRGTWRKKSSAVSGRRPIAQDKILDYEVDSADEWEEEEPGESLHGSDDEKEQESEDEYEVDNSVFVPHGYLSDDEGDEDESEEVLSPETQKAKLKLLGEEFEAQMKSKTSALKPIIIVLTAALQATSCSVRYQKLVERRVVWQEDEGPINLSQLRNLNDPSDGQGVLSSDPNVGTFSSGRGAKKKIISEEAIPALITLVHGNQNRRVFLTNEFSAFLGLYNAMKTENSEDNPGAPSEEGSGQSYRPSTPSSQATNLLKMKWPGLPPASRISISNKIKEIATWGPCPEEGPMFNRQCWYVSEELRVKYGVADMKLPNKLWHYTLKPKVFNHINSPTTSANPSSPGVSDSRALITKFTKIMTPEEKERQWESMKKSGASSLSSSKLSSNISAGKITNFTQHDKTSVDRESKQHTSGSNAPTMSSQPQAKKRVPLLVSVPRGQQISSSHCSLLSKFEASEAAGNSTSSPSSSNKAVSNCSNSAFSVNKSSEANNSSSSTPHIEDKKDDCIVLD